MSIMEGKESALKLSSNATDPANPEGPRKKGFPKWAGELIWAFLVEVAAKIFVIVVFRGKD